MPTWVVAPNIKSLFASINKIAPERDHESDGTVGDLAHQQGTSGHNPDDYPGVTAERQDADRVAEVRAGDIDRDLRIASILGDDMEKIVQTVVRTPALRKRLIYVIYNRRIWSASNGWREEPYTGPNPHTHHAHFSGNPDYDNDTSPWREIEALVEDDMPLTTADKVGIWTHDLKDGDGVDMAYKVVLRGAADAAAAKVEATKARLTAEATLAAVKGLNTGAILARINEVAANETERDAKLVELVRALADGELTAQQVLVELRELLPAA